LYLLSVCPWREDLTQSYIRVIDTYIFARTFT